MKRTTVLKYSGTSIEHNYSTFFLEEGSSTPKNSRQVIEDIEMHLENILIDAKVGLEITVIFDETVDAL